MLASDLIALLTQELGVADIGLSPDGEAEYGFDRPFRFVLTELDAWTVALFAPIPLPAALSGGALWRRLLEANLQGRETGQGALCLTAGDEVGYRDVIDLRALTLPQAQLRFVDFSLYADFWRAEGAQAVAEDVGGDAPPDEGAIRL